MDMYEELNIERLIDEPIECQYRTVLREFFEYDVPLKCPYRSMLKTFFEKLKDQDRHDSKTDTADR